MKQNALEFTVISTMKIRNGETLLELFHHMMKSMMTILED